MKLFCIPSRARAEPIRMLLAYGKIQFEDVVIPFNGWPKEKRDRTRFPFAQVPTMQLPSGTAIAQTSALIRCEALPRLLTILLCVCAHIRDHILFQLSPSSL
jgi:glutathione S-transferase